MSDIEFPALNGGEGPQVHLGTLFPAWLGSLVEPLTIRKLAG